MFERMRSDWRRLARERVGLLTTHRVLRALWLGTLIGVIAGVGAIVFMEAIRVASHLLLETLAGYKPPEPLGEGTLDSTGPARLWALPLVLGLGGLLAGLLVYTLAPEAEGHGTDAAIDSFHHRGGRVRWQVIPVKLLASAITIGAGGAAGREGPTAQIGGGFGSVLADRLNLGAIERRRALAAGMGAGIGAIFRAPLGGAMMGAEVFYKHDFEADVILLGLISSIVSFSIFGAWFSYDPIFGLTGSFTFSHAYEIPYYAALGAFCAGIGYLYTRAFYATHHLFNGLSFPRVLKPAVGGLLAGTIGMAIPESIHVGYGVVQETLEPGHVATMSLTLLVALPFARIATTSLTVGSGGSGGIFGPGMVIGGITGALFWRLFHTLPGFPAEAGPVIIIAMIALFGSIAHAPLAMLLMVAEMTGNLSLLAPAMVAVAVATLLIGDLSIYEKQVATRADSPAHRHRFAFPLLSALPVHRAATPVPILPIGATVREATAVLARQETPYALATAPDGSLVGEITREALEHAEPEATLDRYASKIPTVPSEAPFDVALDLLADHERRWLPVVDPAGNVAGVFDAKAVLRAYRRAANDAVRPLNPLHDNLPAVELTVPPSSPIANVALAAAELPMGVRILTIERDGTVTVPTGATVIAPHDRMTVVLPPGTRARAFERILGTH